MSYQSTYRIRARLLAGLILTPMLIQLAHPLIHHHHHEGRAEGYAITHGHEEFCPIGSFEYFKFQNEDAPSLSRIVEYPLEMTPGTTKGYRDKAHISSITTRAPPLSAA